MMTSPRELPFADAQRDMRHAYYAGAPGLLASSIAWLAAGLVAAYGTPERAVLALFVGGMLIHPTAVLFTKILGRPGTHLPGNPLGALALETTVWLLVCLPLAYAVSQVRPAWFFPTMLLVIGGRYFSFSTIYGTRLYWVCGATLGGAGFLLLGSQAGLPTGAFVGAAIEMLFAIVVFYTSRSRGAASPR